MTADQGHSGTIIKPGHELTAAEIAVINDVRRQEFAAFPSAHRPIEPTRGNESGNEIYVLAKDGLRVLAFGRLRVVQIRFRNETFRIWGVVTVASAIKGRGFGAVVMNSARNHIRESGRSAVGFCEPATSIFYEKCGFQILRRGILRFVEKNAEATAADPPSVVDDAFVFSGTDDFVEQLAQFPDEPVYLEGLRW